MSNRPESAVLLCRVSFWGAGRFTVPDQGNVTIQCGGRFIYTTSAEGPMRIGPGAVIGFQDCNVNTYGTGDQAIADGRAPYPLLNIFGNMERSVAQIYNSTVLFPGEVRSPRF